MPDIHPMEAKKQLAFEIVERYHSIESAQAALDNFNTRFSKRDLAGADLLELCLDGVQPDLLSIAETGYKHLGVARTRGDIRRLIQQGSVQINGEKFLNPKSTPVLKAGDVLRLDKTHAVRIRAG